jgi:hypothetical protein
MGPLVLDTCSLCLERLWTRRTRDLSREVLPGVYSKTRLAAKLLAADVTGVRCVSIVSVHVVMEMILREELQTTNRTRAAFMTLQMSLEEAIHHDPLAKSTL